MESNKKNSNAKSLKTSIKKKRKKIIIGAIIISVGFGSPFIINFLMQLILQTQHPLVICVSDSMNPAINTGDLLLLQGKNPENIINGTIEGKEGDIIVYDAHGVWDGWIGGVPDEPIVHRVVDKWYDNYTGKWMFYTKGDNEATNTNIDPPDSPHSPIDYKFPVPEDKILGVVIGRVPFIGYINIFLSDNSILLYLIIGILATLLVISVVWDIFSSKEEKPKEEESKLTEKKDMEEEVQAKKVIIQDEFEE